MTDPTPSPIHPNVDVWSATMTADKQCKGSVRYAARKADAPIQSVYVKRTFRSPMPDQLTITVSLPPE